MVETWGWLRVRGADTPKLLAQKLQYPCLWGSLWGEVGIYEDPQAWKGGSVSGQALFCEGPMAGLQHSILTNQ